MPGQKNGRSMKRSRQMPQGLHFYEKKTRIRLDLLQEVFLWLFYTAIAAALAVILSFSFGKRITVYGESMEPAVHSGQQVLIDRVLYWITSVSRYDVIAFYPGGNEDASPYVKRVIGMPGDTIRIENGQILINGIPDPQSSGYSYIEDSGVAGVDIPVAADEYFVIGDNRNSSEDSRSASIGNVRKSSVIGKVWFSLPKRGMSFGRIR